MSDSNPNTNPNNPPPPSTSTPSPIGPPRPPDGFVNPFDLFDKEEAETEAAAPSAAAPSAAAPSAAAPPEEANNPVSSAIQNVQSTYNADYAVIMLLMNRLSKKEEDKTKLTDKISELTELLVLLEDLRKYFHESGEEIDSERKIGEKLDKAGDKNVPVTAHTANIESYKNYLNTLIEKYKEVINQIKNLNLTEQEKQKLDASLAAVNQELEASKKELEASKKDSAEKDELLKTQAYALVEQDDVFKGLQQERAEEKEEADKTINQTKMIVEDVQSQLQQLQEIKQGVEEQLNQKDLTLNEQNNIIAQLRIDLDALKIYINSE